MNILDIRIEQEETEAIIFSESDVILKSDGESLIIETNRDSTYIDWDDYENFRIACDRAYELWGKKP